MEKLEPHQHHSRLAATLAIFAGATAIGFAPILVRFSEAGPCATAFYRVLFALPFFALVTACSRKVESSKDPGSASRRGLIILTGIFFVGDLGIWHWSLQFTSVANSTLLSNSAPLFVVIAARVFLQERITPRLIGGIAVTFSGAVLLLLESLQISPRNLFGDVLALATAIFYSGYLVTIKKLRGSMNTSRLMTYSGLVSCPLFLLVAALSRENLLPHSARGWSVVIALGLISHLGGQGLIAYGLAHLPASFSSVTLLWQPVVAAVLASFLLEEKLTTLKISGGVVVLAGIFLAQRGSSQTSSIAGNAAE